MAKACPDPNDTLRTAGPEGVRKRHANAKRYNGPDDAPKSSDGASLIRFKLISFDELKSSSTAKYLVKGLLPGQGLVEVWGPPKCGKSFWLFTVAMHIAMGLEYRGRRVTQGEIVYLALEGQSGFGNRAEAFRQRFLKPGETVPAFKLCCASLDLIKDHPRLIADIKQQSVKPACVVIDTMNRSLVGSESKDEDMAAYLRAADVLQQAFGCLVVIIHHCGVNETRPRGHTSQTGAADVQISVKKDDGGIITVTVELAKDMAEGATIASRLEEVELGTDQDGDAIRSCVIVPVEGVAARPTVTRKLSDRQKLALNALVNCAADRGKPPPAEFGLPAGLVAVELIEWREEVYRRGVLDREAKNPREDFRRTKNSLAARNLIGERDGLVWTAGA
jgi:AAA domain